MKETEYQKGLKLIILFMLWFVLGLWVGISGVQDGSIPCNKLSSLEK